MVVRCHQLIAMSVAERNRLYLSRPQNRKSLSIIIKALEELEDELARVDTNMNTHIIQKHFKEILNV